MLWLVGRHQVLLSEQRPHPSPQTPEGQVLLPGQPRMGTRTKEALFVEQVEEWQGEQQLGRKGHPGRTRVWGKWRTQDQSQGPQPDECMLGSGAV